MKENYLINIIGRQYLTDDKDSIEVTTVGSYSEKNGKRFIMYKEYDSDKPEDSRTSVIMVEGDDSVTIIRGKPFSSRLILQSGKRHQCLYSTPAGDLLIGVFTNKIQSTLTEDGGSLEVSYSLDFNGDLASENEFTINIKEKGMITDV